jgi:hypothetical protein
MRCPVAMEITVIMLLSLKQVRLIFQKIRKPKAVKAAL